MSMGQYEEDIEIAVGTLSALAFVYSFMQTWGWSKRAGKPCYTNLHLKNNCPDSEVNLHVWGSMKKILK